MKEDIITKKEEIILNNKEERITKTIMNKKE